MRFLLVGLGGAIGSILRYALGLRAGTHTFPWTTLGINLTGSLALGLMLTWSLGRWPVERVAPISVGLLGGFTTFSAFAWEGLFLVRTDRPAVGIAYLAVSAFGGLAAAWLGYHLGRWLR